MISSIWISTPELVLYQNNRHEIIGSQVKIFIFNPLSTSKANNRHDSINYHVQATS